VTDFAGNSLVIELELPVECNSVQQQEIIAVVELWACNRISEVRSEKRKVPSHYKDPELFLNRKVCIARTKQPYVLVHLLMHNVRNNRILSPQTDQHCLVS